MKENQIFFLKIMGFSPVKGEFCLTQQCNPFSSHTDPELRCNQCSVSSIARNRDSSIDGNPLSPHTDQDAKRRLQVVRPINKRTYQLYCIQIQVGHKVGQIRSHLIYIVQEDSPVKKCQPGEGFECILGAWRTKAAVGPGILFSKFEFKPIGMRHGLTKSQCSRGIRRRKINSS